MEHEARSGQELSASPHGDSLLVRLLKLTLLLFVFSLPYRDSVGLFGIGIVKILGALLIYLFLVALITGSIRLNRTVLYALAVLYVIKLCVMLLASMKGYPLNAVFIVSYLQYYLLALIVASVVDDYRLLRLVAFSLLLAGALVSLDVVLTFNAEKEIAEQLGSSSYRGFGGFRNPANLALYLLSVIPLGILLLRVQMHLWVRICVTGSLILCGAGLMLAFMRSAYVALVLILIVIAVESAVRKGFRSFVPTLIGFTGVIVIALMIISLLGFDKLLLERLDSMKYLLGFEGGDASVWMRTNLQLSAIKMFESNPLVGVGPGNQPFLVGTIGLLPQHITVENMYLQILAETGLIGFTAMLMVGFHLFIQVMRSPPAILKRVFAFGLFGFGLYAVTLSVENELILYVLIGAITSRAVLADQHMVPVSAPQPLK